MKKIHNVLVVDDKETNRKAAKAQIEKFYREHKAEIGLSINCVSSVEEAQKILNINKHGFGHGNKFIKYEKSPIDILLCDLMLEVPEGAEYTESPPEEPAGIFLALKASLKGVPVVGVFTDACHHKNYSSSLFDMFNSHETTPEKYGIGEGILCLSNNRSQQAYFKKGEWTEGLTRIPEDANEEDYLILKDWSLFLQDLLSSS